MKFWWPILKASDGGDTAIDEDLILTDRESFVSEPVASEVLDESIAVVDDNLYALRLKVREYCIFITTFCFM